MRPIARVKICFKNDIREILLPKTYSELKEKFIDIYKENLLDSHLLYYESKKQGKKFVRNPDDYNSLLPQIVAGGKFIIQEVKTPATKPQSFTEDEKRNRLLSIEGQPITESGYISMLSSSAHKIYRCFHCNGNRLSGKGKACKHCNGSGTVTKILAERVRRMVIVELRKILRSDFPQYVKQQMKAKATLSYDPYLKLVVHHGVVCDKCEMYPIIGPRYSCTFCRKFNLCEDCEQETDHTHPLLKMKEAQPKQLEPETSTTVDSPRKADYAVEFVKNPLAQDEISTFGGMEGIKRWTVKNVGELPWPKDTFLLGADDSKVTVRQRRVDTVEPGESIEVEVVFRAPRTPGAYTSICRLADKEGRKFVGSGCLEVNVKKCHFDASESGYSETLTEENKVTDTSYKANVEKLSAIYKSIEPELILGLLKKNNNDPFRVSQQIENAKKPC